MGTGIAIVAARIGNMPHTHIIDATEEGINNSRQFIENWLDKEINKER